MAAFLKVLGPAVILALASCKDDSASDAGPICGPATEDPPADLACTGLYADFATKKVAETARPYAPAVSFWSDGYEKTRFISLPAGTTIDASVVDDWTFPAGTKVWKEFRRGERKIETRLFWKVKDGRWVHAAYVWSEDGSTATRGDGRTVDVEGRPYKVPSNGECQECHRGRKEKLLGFEALSLAQPGASGVTLAVLAAENRLAPPPARTTVSLPHPGVAVLHVNCGVTCHNTNSGATAFQGTLRLRLGFDEVATKPVESWQLLSTAVGVQTELPGWDGAMRIAAGAPEKSAIVSAMKTRGTGQMPPIATRDVDVDGVRAVEAWVRTLPPPR